jgi:hypothetical protein
MDSWKKVTAHFLSPRSNPASTLVRFEKDNVSFYFEKICCLLKRWCVL